MSSISSASEPVAPIAVAMDAPSLSVLGEWAAAVAPVVSTLKVGLEVFSRDGAAAVETARFAAAQALPNTRITAVTVLTSLSEGDLAAIGLAGPSQAAVVRLASLAVEAGARAIVCSPQEVAAVRAHVPADITLITPGVRPAGASLDDQQRVATPEQALSDGADLLVIGRPITGADDPRAAASTIASTLARRS